MDLPEKVRNFIYTDQYFQIIDKLDEVLNIDPNDMEKDSKVALFVDRYFTERLSGESLREFIKNTLDFISEEEIEKVIDFMTKNFLDLRESLWQEEEIKETEGALTEETFEEKEKRYLEMMKNLIKSGEVRLQLKKEEKPIIQEKKQEEKEEFKTITFTPQKEHLIVKEESPTEEVNLPESTIIIKKESTEIQKPADEGTLDLSKL